MKSPEYIKRNKWTISWTALSTLFFIYTCVLLLNYNEQWCTAFMQIGSVLLSLIAMVIIMLHTFAVANEGAEKQIEIYKSESLKQILAISDSTNLQIEHLKAGTKEQINAIQSESQKQINNLNTITQAQIQTYREESEKHIRSIQEATKQQIDSFVEQTNAIVDRLEKLSESMTDLTELNKEMLENEKELRELELKKVRKREEEIRSMYNEKSDFIERIRPELHFRTEINTHNLFWKYIFFYIHNGGGEASSIIINVSLKSSNTNQSSRMITKTYTNVSRMREFSFKWLRAKEYIYFDLVVIEISTRDIEQREYYGHWQFNRQDGVWLKIDLSERNNFGLNSGSNSNFLT